MNCKSLRPNHCVIFTLLSLFIYILPGYSQATTISWSASYPYVEDVNIGSGKPSNLYLKFEIENANAMGSTIDIVFPNDYDFYESANPALNIGGGGAITLNPPVWNAATRTLTFPAKDLLANSIIWYKIPHRATDAIPQSVSSGTIQVKIKDISSNVLADTSLTYNYNRAALLITNPATSTGNQTGLTLNFASNNGSQNPGGNTALEYRMGMQTAGGSIDSARIKLTIPENTITVTPNSWTCNGIAIDRITSINSGGNIIYTLFLEKKHSIGTDGFDNGEKVDISVMLKKNFCGSSDINMEASWGSNGNYITPVQVPGSFSADTPGNPTLTRVRVTPENLNTIWNFDGTPNKFITSIKNTGAGPATRIKSQLEVSNFPYIGYLDTYVEYKLNNGAWTLADNVSIINTLQNTGGYQLDGLAGKPRTIEVLVNNSLQPGDSIILRWGACIPSKPVQSTGSDIASMNTIRILDTWTCSNACDTISVASTLVRSEIYRGQALFNMTKNSEQVNLLNGTSQYTNIMSGIFYALSTGSGQYTSTNGAYFEVKVTLPKGIILDATDPAKIHNFNGSMKTGVVHYSVGNLNQPGTNDSTYSIIQIRPKANLGAAKYDFYLNFKGDCSTGAANGTYKALIDFSYAPTGTISGSGANVLMPLVGQYTYPVTLTCNMEGVSYNTHLRRISVGWPDASNTGTPDSQTRIDSSTYSAYNLMDHTQIMSGDTAEIIMNGKILSSGYKKLYVVVHSQPGTGTFHFLPDGYTATSSDGAVSISSLNTSATGFINPSTSTSGRPNGYQFAYLFEIERPGGTAFSNNASVDVRIKYKAVNNNKNYTYETYGFGTWFYATTNGTSNPGKHDNSARKGDEVYILTSKYNRAYLDGWPDGGVLTIPFNSERETKNIKFHLKPLYADWNNPLFSPYEYRSLTTVNSIAVEAPQGYILGNTLTLKTPGAASTVTATATSATSANNTYKEYIISSLYDSNYGAVPPAGMLKITDGDPALEIYPQVTATNWINNSASDTCKIYATTDNTTYTQAYVPNGNQDSFKQIAYVRLQYPDFGRIRLSSNEGNIKNVRNKDADWNVRISNTKQTSDPNPTAIASWLYVAGNVKNIQFIENGGSPVAGQGFEGRWIKLPNVNAQAHLDGDLKFEPIYNGTCNDDTLLVYTVFNTTNTSSSWTPSNINLAIDTEYQYTYPSVQLILRYVNPAVSMVITPWSNAPVDPQNPLSAPYGDTGVDKDRSFTVEVIADASSSGAPITNVRMEMDFPKGLSYHVDSAYIEYKNTILKITDPSWINQLNTLVGDNNAHSNLQFNLIDLYATQSGSLQPLFGDNATIDGGEKLYFRFKLMPTCDIALTGERIGSRFYGKQFCDTTQNINISQTQISDRLTLLNPSIGYRSGLFLSPVLDSLVCEPGLDTAPMQLVFFKRNKASEPMSASDSIRIAIPSSLEIIDSIQYTYPAYNLHGINIPADNGVIPESQMNTYSSVDGKMNYFSWPVPKAYLDQLATQSVANDSTNAYFTYNWTVKAGGKLLQGIDTTKIHAATIAEYGVHITCPNNILAEADSSDQKIILIPSRNALLSNLIVNGQQISGFSSDKFEYDQILPCGTKTIDISGIPVSECATTTSIFGEALEKYSKRFEIIVTAENGNQQTYVVNARPLMPARIIEDLSDKLVACEFIDYPMHIVAEGDSLHYQWFYDGDSIPGNDNDTLLINYPTQEKDYGHFKVKITGACNSSDESKSARLWVANKLPSPITIEDIPDMVETGKFYTAHVGVEYGYNDITNYTWSFHETDSTSIFLEEGANKQTIHTHFPGKYSGTLRVALEHPCASHFGPYIAEKYLKVINNTGTGIEDNVVSQVRLYPNPFNEELHISVEGKIQSILITDISGRRVVDYKNMDDSFVNINTSSWSKGSYIVVIKTGENISSYKVVKK